MPHLSYHRHFSGFLDPDLPCYARQGCVLQSEAKSVPWGGNGLVSARTGATAYLMKQDPGGDRDVQGVDPAEEGDCDPRHAPGVASPVETLVMVQDRWD